MHQGGVIIPVEKFIIYPTYETANIDAALIKLKKPLTFNSRSQPIKLPNSTYVVFSGQEVLAVGHGATTNPLFHDEVLRGAVLKRETAEKCEVRAHELCTSDASKQNVCFGDSGEEFNKLN